MKRMLILIISGIGAGLLQTCINIPLLALLIYIPAFYNVFKDTKLFSGKLKFLKSWHVEIFFAQLASCSFLVTIYKLIPLPVFVSIPLSVIITIILALWLTLITSLPIMFLSKIRGKKLWDIVSFSMLFVVGEWFCEKVFIFSFPWSTVSLSVVSWSEFVQSASIMGGKFTSLIILIINGFIGYAIMNKISIHRRIASLSLAVICLSATLFYGSNHIKYLKNEIKESGETINVLVAQDNVEGVDKREMDDVEIAQHYLDILDESLVENIDLVLLPETSVPMTFNEKAEEFSGLIKLAKEKNIIICAGAFYNQDDKSYNAMYLITPNGTVETPYLKQILVPFGESIPFATLLNKDTLSCCKDDEYTQPLKTDSYKIGCGICIESIYPSIFREQAEEGGEFFIIPTNDSWFGKSSARYAHYRHSILRSIENQRFTLRSGNCGISAIINPWGEELESIRTSQQGAITSSIKTLQSESLYTKTGDKMFIATCILYLTIRFFLVNTKMKS